MTPQEAASYKSRKEAFVSNLSGSSLSEINLVTLVASVRLPHPSSQFINPF